MNYYVNLAFNLAILVFIFFGVIWGLIRGLRRTASRGIFFIIITILVLFITIPITKAFINMKFNTVIDVGGSTINGRYSISEILQLLIKSLLGENFAVQNPEFCSTLLALPLMLINSIVYVLLFWICKYLLYPLDYLLYRLILAQKKTREIMSFSDFNTENSEITPIPNENEKSATNNINTDEVKIETTETELTSDLNPKEGSFIKKDPNNVLTQKVAHNEIPEAIIENDKKELEEAKRQAKIEAKLREKKPKVKVKKQRLLGGLVGAVVGLIVMFNTMVPLYGFMDIFDKLNNVKLNNLINEQSNVSDMTNGASTSIIDSYNSSVLKLASQYTGLQGLGLAEFDYLTTQKINGKEINLRKEVDAIIDTATKVDALVGDINTINSNGLENISKDNISTIITKTRSILDSAEKITLINCVSEYLIPAVCSYIISNDMKFTGNEKFDSLFVDTIVTLSEDNSINVISEIKSILNLVEYTNEQELITKVLKANINDSLDIINGLEPNFAENFSNKLFALQTVNLTAPYIIDIGLTYADSVYDFGYENISDKEIQYNSIKDIFSSILSNCISLADTIDTNSSIYITTKSLQPIGNLLETIKSSKVVTKETYDNAIDFAIGKIQDLTRELLPEELRPVILNEIVRNIAKVDRWDTEMSKFTQAIYILRDKENGILGEVTDTSKYREGLELSIDIKTEVLVNIGDALDILDGTCIFGAVTTKTINSQEVEVCGTVSIVESLLEYGKNHIAEISDNQNISKLTELINKMKSNLIMSEKHKYASMENFWHNELNSISPLTIELYDIINKENFEISNKLGVCLDTARSGVLLGNDATLALMKSVLEIIEENILPEEYTYNNGTDLSNPQVLDDKIFELISKIKTNLNTITIDNKPNKDTQFWTHEIKAYIALKEVAEKSSELNSVSDSLNLASDLDTINENTQTIPMFELNSVIAFAIKDSKSNETDKISIIINNAIDKISDNIATDEPIEWSKELNALKTLSELDIPSDLFEYPDPNEYQNSAIANKLNENKIKLVELGQVFDNIAFKKEYNSGIYSYTDDNSKVVTRNVINTMIAEIFETAKNETPSTNIDNSFNSMIDDVSHKIMTCDESDLIISWARELEYVTTLVKLNESVEYNSTTIRDGIGTNIDKIAFNIKSTNNEFDDILFNADKKCTYIPESNDGNSLFITREILLDSMGKILEDIKKVDNTGDELTDEQNGIINDIIENITKTIAKDNTQLNENYHKNTSLALNELNQIETIIDNNANNRNVREVNGENIDTMLDELQNTILCKESITKRIALLILKHITVADALTHTKGYYTDLENYYISRINDANTINETEYYNVTDTSGIEEYFPNPFETLINKLHQDSGI